jgi:uncharacterized phage protein gp47/JayE
MLSFAQLLTPVPLEDWKRKIIEVASAVGLQTQNWSEGGYTRTLVALFAQLYTTAGDVIRIIAAGGFLDTAEGDWLTWLARNLFNVFRIEATYAAAPNGITLTNNGGGLYVFDPGDLVVAHYDTGKTYRNTTGGTLNPGEGQTLKLDLIAEEAGSSSGALPGLITIMVSTFLGVTCSNDVALSGLDAEEDEALRDRCRDSLAALSIGGPSRAYEYYAKSATYPDGTPVGITRVLVMPATGDGHVDVYIAGPSGAVTAEAVAAVQASFDANVTPYGFSAIAISATNLSIAAGSEIWLPASLSVTTEAAKLIVLTALQDYVQSVPIGGVVIPPSSGQVYASMLLGEVANAIPGTLKAQIFTSDIIVSTGQVPIWTGSTASVTVHQVS